MRTVLFNLAQAFGILLLADFVAGIVHWLEDAYGTEDTPFVGPLLIRPNIVHHHFPRHFTKLSWWQSSADLLLLGLLLIAAGSWWGFLSWQLWLFVAISVNANQVHKWAHRTRAENGKIITFLQEMRVLQTPRHHALHHTDPKNTYYCPVTNLVNPILERVRFWNRLEAVIERLTGLKHRNDTSNRGEGPGPAWLADYRPVRAGAISTRDTRNRTASCVCTTCEIHRLDRDVVGAICNARREFRTVITSKRDGESLGSGFSRLEGCPSSTPRRRCKPHAWLCNPATRHRDRPTP